MRKLNILALVPDDNAVGYYRLYQPLKTLEKLGLAKLKMTPTFNWGKIKEKAAPFPDLKWFSTDKDDFWPDIIVAQRHDHVGYIALLGALKNYRVPVVVDTDDDVHAVRPFNPGYASYNPDSENVAMNVKLMSVADAITVSTPQLKERHEQYNKPVYVVPNSITKDRMFKYKPRKDEKVRIGWFGSACHWENLQIIQQAVKDIVANFPQVEFYYTNLYGDIWSNPPAEVQNRVHGACERFCKEKHASCNKSYMDFDKYAAFLNSFQLDIGLAPLYDNLFNRAKSNLRILEYWSSNVAVIASPVRPYSETINGKNGLLAKEKIEWYNAMERLILDRPLREKLKAEGRKTLEKDYSAEKNALKLYKTYSEIKKNYVPRRSNEPNR